MSTDELRDKFIEHGYEPSEQHEEKELKLYGFIPQGHGQFSFFTMAHSEEEAFQIIDADIKAGNYGEYETGGWGTDYYSVESVGYKGVLINNND